MTPASQAFRPSGEQSQWVVNYRQSDVDTIREQIIQGEALKRRWLILGLIIATAAFTGSLILLSSSYALYARTSEANDQLTRQNAAMAQRTGEVQQTLDERNSRDADQARTSGETLKLLERLLPAASGESDVSGSEGGRIARAVSQLGGSFATTSKPSSKLFRNWKVNTDSATEIYTVVGGFVDGKWIIYSNLVARKPNETPSVRQGS